MYVVAPAGPSMSLNSLHLTNAMDRPLAGNTPPAANAKRYMPMLGNSETDAYVLPAFRRGLNKQGYVEGRNVTIRVPVV
jgi:hypothetical protein